MKREEKNQQTRRRILDSALSEFARSGYSASSINAICGTEGISKGIVYHYFETKDDLFLACVEECFQALCTYLTDRSEPGEKTPQQQLTDYFQARLHFFLAHPLYQRIFCDAVILPPAHLAEEIAKRKAGFDRLNAHILNGLLDETTLRPGLTKQEAVDALRGYQDYINARYQIAGASEIDIKAHEHDCRLALSIFLYGVLRRKEDGCDEQ